jgi:anti-sigma regulatory factor (Ser/Thr protein kinase)
MEIPMPQGDFGAWIAQFQDAMEPLSLPSTLLHDVHLVIEEVATNVYKYGGAGGEPPNLRLDARVDGNRLTMEFNDDGVAFDPLAAPPPDLDADLEERPVGGLGVHMVRELAEHVAYTRDQDRNVLRVVLQIPDPEASP